MSSTPVIINICLYTAVDDLGDVSEAVHDLTDWKRFGLQLGLSYPTLTKIEDYRHHKPDVCKMDMLSAWLNQQDDVLQKGVPSWSVLRAALKRMGENELASRIMVSCKYIFVMVCVVSKLSLMQHEKEEEEGGEEEKKEEEGKEETVEAVDSSEISGGGIRYRRNSSVRDGHTGRSPPPLPPLPRSLTHVDKSLPPISSPTVPAITPDQSTSSQQYLILAMCLLMVLLVAAGMYLLIK